MGRFEGRVAYITGGARGMGRSHAIALAREGADIAVCDLAAPIDTVTYPLGTLDDLEETSRLVEAEGRRCITGQLDVRDLESQERFVARIVSELGSCDLAIANAGIVSHGVDIDVMTAEEWETMIAVDLNGVFHTIRAVAPQMKQQGYGRIVAPSSMVAMGGHATIAHYCAAKWGVIGLIKSAAAALVPFGITVNAVAPGTTRTPMVVNDSMVELLTGGNKGATFDEVAHILGPLIEPSDISNAVLFLLSDEARHVNGVVLEVPGAG